MNHKQGVVILGLMILTGVCIVQTVPAAADCPPRVRLPVDYVTMIAQAGNEAWFTMELTDVPAGFDIVDGQYFGWCIQKDVDMDRNVKHSVMLYSSYDTDLPDIYADDEWDKINYVLNHRQGDRNSVQEVFWYYADNQGMPSNADAQAMIAEAEENGSGFCPGPGEYCAVALEGVHIIQRTFLELVLPDETPLGDLVWNDLDGNGIQDKGEPGIASVEVSLYTSTGELVTSSTTNDRGVYSFTDITNGSYYLQVTVPNGYHVTDQDQGTDDVLDSDLGPTANKTEVFLYDGIENQSFWDFGLICDDGSGVPTKNHPPSANGLAGEPYKGFTGESITFNGSRSYDRDGTIVSYRWTFGDGTTADGAVASHVYTTPGQYMVSLTVFDDDNASDSYQTAALVMQANRPPSPPTAEGSFVTDVGVSSTFTFLSHDPDGGTVHYVIDWGDGTSTTTDPASANVSVELGHAWQTSGLYHIIAVSKDSQNASSAPTELLAYVSIHFVGSYGYLIDSTGTGVYDGFYSNVSGDLTTVSKQGSGQYLIDTDGDGAFDVLYAPDSGTITLNSTKSPTASLNFITLGGIVLVAVLVIAAIALISARRKR